MTTKHSPDRAVMLLAAALALQASASFISDPPAAPGKESWGFREELARPENAPKFAKADADLRPFWVSNRISRCYFGPIKRPPLNHDELMDDVDYYPEPYLQCLQREGVNGLWLTVEWRELAQTSFTPRHPDAARRLAKLRKTVARCLKYGIKTWIFCIEPKKCGSDDPLYREHPELFGCTWGGHLMCPLAPAAQRYIEESVRDIFQHVPDLGGIMMISHGERATTCLSTLDPVSGKFCGACPRCSKVEPWRIHWETASAIMRGIRAAGSSAGYISWLYQPQVPAERAPWIAELARHVPDGVTLAYNFESGAEREQLGKIRHGGDYWLSYVGPANGFRRVAEAARAAKTSLGAKIQVCSSHEVATVPYVPVPGLLYRKYKSMREMGVSTVLQCWYFGNYPGLMNEAAGLLSRSDFTESEDEFLERLAAPWWGPDAKVLADAWKRFSDAYAAYPLSNDMQYYGPFHAGPAWPLLPDVELAPLGRTWKPHDAPSGDAIGECLENHTIEEAVELSRQMAEGVDLRDAAGNDVLDALAARWAGDRDRLLDIGVMKALACQFTSGHHIFSFYLARAKALYESRLHGDFPAALAALDTMASLVAKEENVTRRLLPLAQADSRLGFHSEAEVHQYFPAKLVWRLGELQRTRMRLAEIRDELVKGKPYPLSEHERTAPSCAIGGGWTTALKDVRFRLKTAVNGDLTVEVEQKVPDRLRIVTLDAAGVSFYRTVWSETGTHLVVRIPAASWGNRADRRPSWLRIMYMDKNEVPLAIWPRKPISHADSRLNLSPNHAADFGRIIWPAKQTHAADF